MTKAEQVARVERIREGNGGNPALKVDRVS